MRLFISLFFLFLLLGCGQNAQVYWCGDHACINKKEKEEYFKKTMIVEVKTLNKNKKKDLSELEIIKNRAGLSDNKTLIKKEEILDNSISNKENKKDLKKRILIEQKNKIKEEKKKLKQAKIQAKKDKQEAKKQKKHLELEKKKLAKLEKKITKQKKREEKKIIKRKKADNDIKIETSMKEESVLVSRDSVSNKFSELVENIYKKNMFKSYPNINDIP